MQNNYHHSLIIISIMSYNCHFIFKIYSVSSFQVQYSIMLCIKQIPESTNCLTEGLYHLTNIFPFSLALNPSNCHSILFLQVWHFKIPFINYIIQYLSFWVWLIWLSIMSSRFIHVVKNDKFSFPLMAEYISLHIYYIFVHSFVEHQFF